MWLKMRHPGLAYQQIAGVPGEYFRCAKLSAEFSTDSCAKRWQAQQGRDHIGMPCYRCPIGASHAGKAVDHAQFQKFECVRCHQHSHKLVRGLLCVSCYNRQQEVLKGQDRRGRPPKPYERLGQVDPAPKKLVAIHVFTIRFVPPGAQTIETCEYQGADRQEAMLAVLRRYPTPPVFLSIAPIESGQDLFGGYHRYTRGSR